MNPFALFVLKEADGFNAPIHKAGGYDWAETKFNYGTG